jgi:hypothetical protein
MGLWMLDWLHHDFIGKIPCDWMCGEDCGGQDVHVEHLVSDVTGCPPTTKGITGTSNEVYD